MNNSEDYWDLHKYIRRNDTSSTLEILRCKYNLNVMDQSIFNMAMESQNIAIVTALLEYFENFQLSYGLDDYENKKLKHKMHDILEKAIADYCISENMKNVLAKYVNFDSDIEQDLNEEDFIFSSSAEDDNLYFENSSNTDELYHNSLPIGEVKLSNQT